MMNNDKLDQTLFDEVKNYLNITWDDEATDNKIRSLILSGMAYLDEKNGYPVDYTKYGIPRSLLMEYVRYARDSALDVFETNYMSLIISMRNKRRTLYYVEETI